MKQALLPFLLAIADAGWRRRNVLIVPFLIVLPLTFMYLKFGPRSFVAKSLLLVQENSRDNPLATPRDLQVVVNMQDRIVGLQALLKSDRVLNSVMMDIVGDRPPTDAKEAESYKLQLGNALQLDLVGNDFLQLQMKASTPKDLGRKLEAVVSRFIEALLPAQDVTSAMQVLVERRKEELDAAEQDFKRTQREVGPEIEDSLKVEAAKLASLRGQLDRVLVERDQAARSIVALKRQVEGLKSGGPQQGPAGGGEAQKAAPTADPKDELRKTEARQAALDKEIQLIGTAAEKQKRRVDDMRRIDDRYKVAASDVERARRNYEALARRFNSPLTAGSAPNILSAPERIKIIDLPRDPVLPATSSLKIIAMVTAATLIFAVGLAFLLELLDPIVRSADRLQQLSGLPVLTRVPWPSLDAEPEPEPEQR